MKKATLITAAALMLGSVLFTSCKKDFTCVCSIDGQDDVEWAIPKTTKALAKTACETSDQYSGWDCKLK